MKTYITKLIKGFFVSYPEEIDAVCWEGLIGTTYEDFINGKWVLLSDEQVAFREQNPNASVKEVFDMQLSQDNLQDDIKYAKFVKLDQIDQYDASSNVNGFEVYIEGQSEPIEGWFSAAERSNYRASIDAAKLLGVNSLSFYIGDASITISTELAEQLLAQIQLYADQCFIVTKQHKAAVEELSNIEDINNYDYTIGYPSKLIFML